MYRHAAALTKRYGERMFADDDASRRFVKSVAYVGAITTHYRTQHANFEEPTAWPFACTAGELRVAASDTCSSCALVGWAPKPPRRMAMWVEPDR